MGLKDKLKAARNPGESEQFALIAEQVAAVERDLHGAIARHYEAIGADAPPELMDAEERVAQLKRLVGYQVDGNLWGYFVAEQAPDELENTDAAKQYAGLPLDEWAETWQTWADNLREQVDADGLEDRDLADRYVQQRFGVELDTFEAAVVEWSPGRTMEWATRGPIDREIARLEAATDSITAVEMEDEPEGDSDE